MLFARCAQRKTRVGASERRSVGASILRAVSFSAKVEAENFTRPACAGALVHGAWGRAESGKAPMHGARGLCQWQAGHVAMHLRAASVPAGSCMMHEGIDSLAAGSCTVHGARGSLAKGSRTVHGGTATLWVGPCMMHRGIGSMADGSCMVHGTIASRETALFSAICRIRSANRTSGHPIPAGRAKSPLAQSTTACRNRATPAASPTQTPLFPPTIKHNQ